MNQREIKKIIGVFTTNGVQYATAGAAAVLLNLKIARVYQLMATQQLASEPVLGWKQTAVRLSTIREYQKQNGKK